MHDIICYAPEIINKSWARDNRLAHEKRSIVHETICDAHDIISRIFEILCCTQKKISRAHKMYVICLEHEIICLMHTIIYGA